MAKDCSGYIFGVDGEIAGIKTESTSGDSGPQYVAEAKDSCGRTRAIQLGRPTGTCTVSGYFFNGVLPALNAEVTVDGRKFFVDKVTKQSTNTDFQKVDMTGKFWADPDNSAAELTGAVAVANCV